MALFIEIRSADGMVSRTQLDAGKNRFTVRLGDNYRIIDDQTGATPEGVAVKRVDNNLVVDGLDAQGSTVEFAEYYNICSAGSPCALTIDQAAGGQQVVITPGTQPIGALADGAFVLYDQNFAETAPAAPSLNDGTALRYGLYGLGGLAVVGLAAGGGGGGGGDGGGGGGGIVRPDGALKLTSSEFVNSRTPTFTGEGEPGSRVILRIDTDGDGSPNVTYATTVGADFKWSINLATAVPESGGLPAGGLPDQSNVGISSATNAGNASLPTFLLSFDGIAPTAAVIDAVAVDNVVNLAEKTSGVPVSGSGEPGATVTVTWGAQVRTALVDADGRWQTPAFDSGSIPPDGASSITAVVQDRAGNNSPQTQLAVTINTAPAVLTLAPGTELINKAEAAAGITLSGQADPGGTVAVVWNGVAKPAVTANASGVWKVALAPGEIPSADNANVPYTIAATNPAGNTAALTGQAKVDTVAPLAPAISPVTGDNLVTLVDTPAAGIGITGTAEAGSTVNVIWGGKGASAVANGGGAWTVVFAASNLPADGAYPLSAAATDAAGNSSLATTLPLVTIDLTPPPLAVAKVAGDNLIGIADAAAGVTFSGTTEPGAAVSVNWNGISQAVTAGAAGAWVTTPFAAPVTSASTGTPVVATIIATDIHGNPATASAVVTVDLVAPLPAAPALVFVGTDNIVNAGEIFGVAGAAGSVEAGSAVTVTIGLASQTVAASLAGAWETAPTFQAGAIGGLTSATVTVTDAAGNATANAALYTVLPPPSAKSPDALSLASLFADPAAEISAAGSADLISTPGASWSAAATMTGLTPLDDNYA